MVTAPLACQKQNHRTEIRLQKFLALCGAGSRRACERLIEEGRVSVDGKIVTCQGVKINPSGQVVKLDGRSVAPGPKLYILFNKPRGVLCTSSDPAGRKTFRSFLPALPARVFTVGRLDRDSEGLILITSDGEFSNAISHPRNEVEKTYLVTVNRALAAEELKQLLKGIQSEGEFLRAKMVRPAKGRQKGYVYEITISEGKNRHIRRMFAALKMEVEELKRIAIGPLKLGDLAAGQLRYMKERELAELERYIAVRKKQAESTGKFSQPGALL
jgi:23S rRNA pseudouridine2605 synthase